MGFGRIWDLCAGGVILLGMTQLPGEMALPRLVARGGRTKGLGGALALVDVAPVLPLVLALAGLAGGRIGWGVALGLTLASAPLAAVLALGAAYDAGGGADIILAEGAALSLGVWGMLWCMAGQGGLGRVLHGPAVAAALWSLITPWAVARSAEQVSEGAAYCVARHEADRPIRSWAELRGVSFHTNRSGYKDTSTWYLHGVMLVDRGEGVEAWNWSPRHMRFERVERPEDMLVSPFGACQPVSSFMSGLSLL